jgi:hypothetical protein
MVWTRKLDGERMVGRLKVARAIRAAIGSCAEVENLRLPSAVTDRTLGRLLGVAQTLALSWLRGQPLPLQCAIFGARADVQAICRALPDDAETIYLDGIRCFELLRLLRQEWPGRRIVVDFDDLMSRRMQLLLAAGQSLSPGYMTDRLPRGVARALMGKWVGWAMVQYEARTLAIAERKALELADAVVLLSSEDAAALERIRVTTPSARAEIATIPPAVAVEDAEPLSEPLRFVFVGTDSLTQNRLTIDYLLDTWRRERITTPLVIFGHQTRRLALPEGVTMPGYAQSLATIHDGHSVLVTPSFLRGGIKTKVLEAFSLGTPVLGNSQTFESMPVGDYPLRIDDEAQLVAILRRPAARLDLLRAAVAGGRAYLQTHHAPEVFASHWRHVTGATAPLGGTSHPEFRNVTA